MEIKSGREGGVPGLSRGLLALEYLCKHEGGVRISTLAEALHVPDNTMMRVMATLCDHGYATRDEETLGYTASRKVLSIARRLAEDRQLVDCALPSMRELCALTEETVVLAVWDQAAKSAVIIEQVPSPHTFRFVCDYGHHPRLHVSSCPKAIVAFFPDEERDRILKGYKFRRFTGTTLTSRKAFEKELASIRQRGYALDREEEMEGMLCASGPIFNCDGGVFASVTVTGPRTRIDPKRDLSRFGEAVKACTEAITAKYTNSM